MTSCRNDGYNSYEPFLLFFDMFVSYKYINTYLYGCMCGYIYPHIHIYKLSTVQSPSHVQLFVTPWTTARQVSLSITNSQSLLKLMSIKLVMTSNHLIFCCPLLLLPSIFPNIRVFMYIHIYLFIYIYILYILCLSFSPYPIHSLCNKSCGERGKPLYLDI